MKCGKDPINRVRAERAFEQYTAAYDSGNPRIALKIDHTLRVAALCERIATSVGLPPDDVDLAWLLGLVHDIGRFEQVRRYDSFNDSSTMDHAALGVETLFGTHDGQEPLIRLFSGDESYDAPIRVAVGTHSAFRLPEGIDARTRVLCEVLRDADKIDILKVNCTCAVEDIYGVTDRCMAESALSPECEALFYQHTCLPRDVRRYPADILLGQICFAWELVFDESLQIIREQGHLRSMLDRRWDNPATQASFSAMAAHMSEALGV